MNTKTKESTWIFNNPHPKGLRPRNNCMKRAVTLTTGWDYMFVQRLLNNVKHDAMKRYPNVAIKDFACMEVFYVLAEQEGWEGIDYREGWWDDDLQTVGEFAMEHPEGRYILHTPGHLTTCIGGHIYDTWDCTKEKVRHSYLISEITELGG